MAVSYSWFVTESVDDRIGNDTRSIDLNQQNSRSTCARDFVAECGAEHNLMKSIAAGVIGRMSDAEDIVQQAYSIAIEKNQMFETREKFLGWLVRTVKNCALNFRRKNIRRKTNAVDPAEIQNFAAANESVGTVAEIDSFNFESMQDAFDDDVLRAMSRIPEDARTCMLLKTVEKLSYREIGSLMQIPEGTAMSMVHRARTTLRKELANHEFAHTTRRGTV